MRCVAISKTDDGGIVDGPDGWTLDIDITRFGVTGNVTEIGSMPFVKC